MELKLNNAVTREAVIRALSDKNKENRTAEFVISTEAADSYGTVFKINGWDLARYNRNPVVFYAHRSWGDNPDTLIGTSEVRIENDMLIGVVRFEDAETNPLAEKVWKKIQAGTLRMASIGANPKKGHYGDRKLGEDPDVIYFDESELLEWSIVPIGSNPEALKREASNLEEIKKMIHIVGSQMEPTQNMRSVRERQLLINTNS